MKITLRGLEALPGLVVRVRVPGTELDGLVEWDDDDEMPKVDDANRIQQFRLDDKFQETFDAWAADVERQGSGSLVITHEEVVHQGASLLIFWRISPKPHLARRR